MMEKAETGSAALTLLRALEGGAARHIEDLASTLHRSRKQVSKAASQLAVRGWITRSEGGAGIYTITLWGAKALEEGATITSGPAGGKRKVTVFNDTLRGRAWLAMRARRRFTVGDIVIDAAINDGTERDRANVARYIKHLTEAGYVVELPRRQQGTALTSPGYKVFMLRRNTGRKPPIFRAAAKLLHDPNIGEDVPCSPR
jgi:DNA-binding IclR family transcriptional regulator